jgi:hypothetical protein
VVTSGMSVGPSSAMRTCAACRSSSEGPLPVEYRYTSRCFASNIPKPRRVFGSYPDPEPMTLATTTTGAKPCPL